MEYPNDHKGNLTNGVQQVLAYAVFGEEVLAELAEKAEHLGRLVVAPVKLLKFLRPTTSPGLSLNPVA